MHLIGIRSVGKRVVAEESGSVLAFVAIALTFLVIFVSFVIEVGNWFEHKRHLQVQADAGALAGGGLFNACGTSSAVGNPLIEAEAKKYGGDTSVAPRYNDQIGSVGTLYWRYNSTTFAVGGPGPDDTVTGGACDAKMLDVKITEDKPPWLIKAIVAAPTINASARVEIRTLQSFKGLTPWVVRIVDPKAVFVLVTTAGGAVLERKLLTSSGAQTLNGTQAELWSNVADPLSMTFALPGLYNVVAGYSTNATPDITGATRAEVCSRTGTVCVTPTDDLSYIHVHSAVAATVAAPQVRTVQLIPQVGCPDSSAPYFVLNGTCTYRIRAQIDFGGGASPPAGVEVKAQAPNCPNGGPNPRGCVLTFQGGNTFETTADFTQIAKGGGPVGPISITWNDGGVVTTFADVARPYGADIDADAVVYTAVTESSAVANSLSPAAAHDLVFSVGLGGDISLLPGNAPAIPLRYAGGAENNTGSVRCDGNGNPQYADAIRFGCQKPYQVNADFDAAPCDPVTNPENCIGTLPGGHLSGPVIGRAIEDRFQTPCTPNNWDIDPLNPTARPVIPAGDPRIVISFLTDTNFGNGANDLPIRGFAAFYVTGWRGQGGGPTCADNESYPAGYPSPEVGDVWGHFMNYVVPTGGDPGTTSCDFGGIQPCIATMTR